MTGKLGNPVTSPTCQTPQYYNISRVTYSRFDWVLFFLVFVLFCFLFFFCYCCSLSPVSLVLFIFQVWPSLLRRSFHVGKLTSILVGTGAIISQNSYYCS